MAGDHHEVLFLAAEPAAGLGLDDANLVVGQPHEHGERAMHVVRTLERTVDRDRPAGPGHRHHAVRLDIELLLVAHAILALDDRIGGCEPLLDAALVDGNPLEDRRR